MDQDNSSFLARGLPPPVNSSQDRFKVGSMMSERQTFGYSHYCSCQAFDSFHLGLDPKVTQHLSPSGSTLPCWMTADAHLLEEILPWLHGLCKAPPSHQTVLSHRLPGHWPSGLDSPLFCPLTAMSSEKIPLSCHPDGAHLFTYLTSASKIQQLFWTLYK